MTDQLDDYEELQAISEEPEEKKELVKQQKTAVSTVTKISPIAPQNIDEAWRLSEAFVLAGMVPNSLEGRNQKETTAKVMTVIMKGMEVGFGPAMAIQTIFIVNNKPCIYGDAVPALLHGSRKIEYIKTENKGTWSAEDYEVTVSIKRKDQTEPFVRTFGFQDAKRAGYVGRRGPWTNFPQRMCYWRALSWAARDGAGDALMGLQVAEEVQDITTKKEETDVSSLD